MAQKNSENKGRPPGIFYQMGNYFRLVIRLIGDDRVNPLLKVLPIGSVIYFVIPDPIIGPIEDATFLGLAVYLFVELCPPEVVEEHRRALDQESGVSTPKNDDNVVDAKFVEKESDKTGDKNITKIDRNIK